MAQQGSEVACVAASDDPHAVAVDERLDIGRRVGRDQDGDVRLGLALIIAQFGEPHFLPFAVLGLPQDRPAIAAAAVDDFLGDVGAALTLLDLADLIVAEGLAQELLYLELQRLSLGLLRSLRYFGLGF